MMFLWAICGVPFGVYNVVQNFNIPLQVQPHCFMGFCLVSWAQTLRYHNKWSVWKAALVTVVVACAFAGAEVALILTLRPLYLRGSDVGILVVGILAAVLLAAGLLPPYGELWKRRGRVIGINWIFLSMDFFGAFFSLMALVAQHTFDLLGSLLYIICCLLEIGIFLSHFIWLVRTRRIRKEAAADGKTFDDIAAQHEVDGTRFRFAERKKSKRKAREGDSETGEVTSDGTNDVKEGQGLHPSPIG
ncbi:hypothetical protein QBC44DRAFT_318028 [Cladorrhinum sp. PSN332]|nr:hypothetical protein QBC44DRAFT_318028 [Cladorrhinum sp. PSN332]